MLTRKIFLLLTLFFGSLNSVWAQNQGGAKVTNLKPFLITSTYGVMAGTLIGFGSLAFVETPRDNLRNVAVGASLGLYTGILMGIYAVYVMPMFDPKQNNTPSDDPLNLNGWNDPKLFPTVQWVAKTPVPSLGFEARF